MKKLTVLYDGGCGFCARCRRWLEAQPAFLAMEFLPQKSTETARRFPGLFKPGEREELVVVDDEGGIYRGSEAFVICLYALKEYRAWSVRLSRPLLLPLVRKAYVAFSSRRHGVSRWLGWRGTDSAIARQLEDWEVQAGAPESIGTGPLACTKPDRCYGGRP